MATNQKTLHKNAKQRHAHLHLPVSGSLKSKNLFNTRLTVFPVNMILVKGDKDGVNPSSFDEDDEDTEDDDNDDKGITGNEFSKMTEEQARVLIPESETYNIDRFKNNVYLIANRLLVRPRKSAKGNIIGSHQQLKGF